MIIGITGSSGSGKTTVAKIIAEKINGEIIDADKIVKEEQKIGKPYYGEIVCLFGKNILCENCEINRKALAETIFSYDSKREAINKTTKKYIVPKIVEAVNSIKDKNIILDVPLLFESSLDTLCDANIAIIANTETKLKRLTLREKNNESLIKKRLSVQPKDEFYKTKTEYIIENNNENLEEKVEEVLRKICLKLGKN